MRETNSLFQPKEASRLVEHSQSSEERDLNRGSSSSVRQARLNPRHLSADQVLSLQNTIGNQAVSRLIQKNPAPAQNTIQRVWEKMNEDPIDPYFWDPDNGFLYDALENKFYIIKGKDLKTRQEITEKSELQVIWKEKSYIALKKAINRVKDQAKKQQQKSTNKWVKVTGKNSSHEFVYKHETLNIVYDAVEEIFYVNDKPITAKEVEQFKECQRLFETRSEPENIEKEREQIRKLKEEKKLSSGKLLIEEIDFESLPPQVQNLVIGNVLETILKKKAKGEVLNEGDLEDVQMIKEYLNKVIKEVKEDAELVINRLIKMANLIAGQDLGSAALAKGMSFVYSALSFITSLENYNQKGKSEEDRARQKQEARKKSLEKAETEDKSTKKVFGIGASSLKLKYSMEDFESKKKKSWWEQEHKEAAELLVKEHKCIEAIAIILKKSPLEVAINAIQICGNVSRTIGYLVRLDVTVKYWKRLENLEEHLKNLFSQTSYTGFHGAVPEIEIACQEIARGNVAPKTMVKIGYKAEKPGTSLKSEKSEDKEKKGKTDTQELDVLFKGKEGKQEIREIKADVNALVKKYGKSSKGQTSEKEGTTEDSEHPAQLVSYNLFAEQPKTQVIIYCLNTNGWMNIFNRGAADNIAAFPKITLVLGGLTLDNDKLRLLIALINSYKEALGEQWQEWEWSHDWKTPQEFLEWSLEAPKPKEYKELWHQQQPRLKGRPRSASAPPRLGSKV